MFNNNERDRMTNETLLIGTTEDKEMYRGQLELPATIKEDKKQRADLIETLAKAINILRDGNDIDFALEFIKRHVKGIR